MPASSHVHSSDSVYHMPFRIHSSHICTFSRSLRTGDEGACAAEHLGWGRRSILAVLVVARLAAVVLGGRHRLDDLGIVLAPCEEAVHIPTRACRPCCVGAALDIGTCLGLVADAANSRVDKSGSAAVQWKGLMVVPYFLQHQDAEALVEDTERSAPRTRLDISQMVVRHRSQTAVCWCSQIVDRSVGCRSRQMIALTARILLHLGP